MPTLDFHKESRRATALWNLERALQKARAELDDDEIRAWIIDALNEPAEKN